VVEPVTVAREHVQDRGLLTFRRFRVVVAVVSVVPRGEEPQMAPAAFLCEVADPGRIRLRGHDQVERAGEVRSGAVERVEDRGTGWAGRLGERQLGRLAPGRARPGVA